MIMARTAKRLLRCGQKSAARLFYLDLRSGQFFETSERVAVWNVANTTISKGSTVGAVLDSDDNWVITAQEC